jgi:hypothetical protein
MGGQTTSAILKNLKRVDWPFPKPTLELAKPSINFEELQE